MDKEWLTFQNIFIVKKSQENIKKKSIIFETTKLRSE